MLMLKRAAVVATTLCLCVAAFANTPPAAPVITEPAPGRTLNPADVHMETGPFFDPDPGDEHVCTDWEIWTSPNPPALVERVWVASCLGGVERLHTHLGDGLFIGSHAFRTDMLPHTRYTLRVRHRDSSSDPSTWWSPWSERVFDTGAASSIFPLETDDIVDDPAPQWTDVPGVAVVLPAAPGGQPRVIVETAAGGLLLEIEGENGIENHVHNPPSLTGHSPVRVRVSAGSLASPLQLPETDLRFTTHEGANITIYLPAMIVQPGESNQKVFWVTTSGSTYNGQIGQTEPDFSSLARGSAVPWVVTEPGYRVEVVASGFRLPVNIAFVPNPGPQADAPVYYVTELYGTIKVVLRNGTVQDYASNLLNFTPTGLFPGSGEQGVTGVVVDPQNGDVYATMLYSSVPGVENVPHYPRVVRFRSEDGGRTASEQITILDMPGETQGQSHQISSISFGPDNLLYVHMGDGFNASTGQNLGSYRGKVLRLTRQGAAPVDNPFYNAGDGITSRDYVFAYGLRNPFGGAWRFSDNRLYSVENGPSVDRLIHVVAGRNYLWNGTDASMQNFAMYNWNPASGPVNIAFIQPSVFGGSGFPASKQNSAFVTESGATWANGPQAIGKRITEFVINSAGTVTSGPATFVQYVGAGRATVCGLAAGPDGLYFTDLYRDLGYTSPIDPGANVLRVRFVGDADFVASVTGGPAPLAVQFTDQSTVPAPTAWLWEFGDGATSTQQNPAHTYAEDGVYTVRLTVTGSGGPVVRQRNAYIKVGDVPSIAFIGGSASASAADHAVEHFFEDLGFEVSYYDDEPANRPGAAALAAQHDLIVVSSTITSANVAGEFRTVATPMIFWENALLRPGRESLTDNGTVVSAMSINIVNTAHPITQGFAAGDRVVFTTAANMSVATGATGPGTQILARRSGSTDGAVVVADAGATVAGGYVTPARRVFMFFEDTSWQVSSADARTLMERAVCWALNVQEPSITAPPQSQSVCIGDPVVLEVQAQGSSPRSYQWRRNGTPIPGATARVYTIAAAAPGNAGSYTCTVTNPCGSATSAPAVLQVADCCPADYDGNGQREVADIFAFLSDWFAGVPRAFNFGGTAGVPAIFAFLSAWFAGCP